MEINKVIKRLQQFRNAWAVMFISLMAGIGFIFSSLNMMIWFIEKTGEVPTFFFWIWKGFDLMCYIGGFVMGMILLLHFVKAIQRRKHHG